MASDTSVVFNLLATDKVSPMLSKLGTGFDKLGNRITGFARLAVGAFVGAGIIDGLKQSISAASDLNEAQNKVQVLFGSSTATIQKWAATAATGMGMSTLAAEDAASMMGVFGKAAGLTGGTLVTFSTKMAGLASDLASFYNTSPEDAMQAIGAALRGESEPIRRYGVLLDDASLRQQAFAMHLTNTTKNVLTPQQRVLAAQALIIKQTSAAQGDFGRTSSGLANQQRILSAELTNAKARMGNAFLPTAVKLANVFTTKLLPGLTGVIDKIGSFVGWMTGGSTGARILGAVLGGLGAAILVVVTAIKIWTMAQAALNVIMSLNPIGLVIVAVLGLTAAFIYLWKTSAGFREFFKRLWADIKGIATGIGEAVAGGFKSAVNGLISGLNWVIGHINSVVIDKLNLIPFVNIPHIPEVPHFAKGGIVTRPTLAVVGEAGPEAVVPLGRFGGTSVPAAPARIIIDLTGGDDELIRRIRKRIRVIAGKGPNSVQVALGQG